MQLTAKNVKDAARQFGADIVGIASIDRFGDVEKKAAPSQIFPETRSVIVLGRRITRGSLRGAEEGTQFGLYNLYGYDWLDTRFIAATVYNLAEYLEDNGYEAVPVQNLPTQTEPMGIPVAPDRAAPNVMIDVDQAAVRAGLGEIDYGGFLLTPEFGTRQRVQIILTDANLKPDPIREENLCDFQDKYPGFCPLGAIDPDNERVLDIGGKKMRIAAVDVKRCNECQNGAIKNRYHPSGSPDRIAALCGRSVYQELEQRGKIAASFKTPFRNRPVWKKTGSEV